MPIGPKGPPQKPGLSIRGRVIFDTFRGIPRVRPWPPKKPTTPGSKRNLTAKAFGAANRACKVTEASFYGEHWKATRGTPLLPRDLMIAMMYGRAFALVLEDGRMIRSMASRNDVSKSLDFLGNVPGSALRRGAQYWEAIPGGGQQYVGATIYRATNLGGWPSGGTHLVPFDAVDHDTGGWANLGADATVLTVPANVSRVSVTFQIGILGTSSGTYGQLNIFKNKAFTSPIVASESDIHGTSTAARTVTLPSIDVVEGDTFSARLFIGASGRTLAAATTFLNVKAIG